MLSKRQVRTFMSQTSSINGIDETSHIQSSPLKSDGFKPAEQVSWKGEIFKNESSTPNLYKTLSCIDFSSSFSDYTPKRDGSKEISKQKQETLLDFASDDDIELLRVADTIPFPSHITNESRHLSDTGSLKGDKGSLKMVEKLSPFNKRFRPNNSSPYDQHVRSFSTRKSNSKRLEKVNPTIQLATQVPTEGDNLKGSNANNSPNEKVKSVKPIVLSSEQEFVLQLALQGKSLFYTGSAGTGKSVLLKSIIKTLKKVHDKECVAVTASTGLAACNIGGITLHSFAGVGLGEGSLQSLMKKLRRNKKALVRWNKVKVLVIDEVSMINGNFLNKLDEIAKAVRKNRQPFGGIQLVLCGDFFQLPPVNKPNPTKQGSLHQQSEIEETIFAFESEAWARTITCTIILKEVFRQRCDQKFIQMLNEMRSGNISDGTAIEFKKLNRGLGTHDGIEPAELYSTRYEVDNANNTRLNQLQGETQLFRALDSGSLPPDQKEAILSNFLAPPKLFLKKNAQVMCIKNFDDTLVNGSLGQVVGFMDRNTYMHYNLMKNNPSVPLEQIEQNGKKKVEKDKSNDPCLQEEGHDVALDDSIFDFFEDTEKLDPLFNSLDSELISASKDNKQRKVDFIRELNKNSNKLKYPLVRFLSADGINTREALVEPEQWAIEDENENILAKRIQLPLILAWSLSIHKSQGQTLPKVRVDLKRVFEKGQAYVALSRAVSRGGLQVQNFSRERVLTHPKVVNFYKSLSSTEELAVTAPFTEDGGIDERLDLSPNDSSFI